MEVKLHVYIYRQLLACKLLEGESKYGCCMIIYIYVASPAESAVHDQIDHGSIKSTCVLSHCSSIFLKTASFKSYAALCAPHAVLNSPISWVNEWMNEWNILFEWHAKCPAWLGLWVTENGYKIMASIQVIDLKAEF